MIDRKKLITGHNVVLHGIDTSSPLTVGNGELGYTADVTGMQSLYDDYRELPLCTLSQWGWHTTPVSDARQSYTLDDVQMTEYDCLGRKVYYPKKKLPGNEAVYDWVRQNPHRLNLARIGLLYRGKEIRSEQLGDIEQTLDLYTGILTSHFTIEGAVVTVRTACAASADCLGFDIESALLESGDLCVEVRYPYGSPKISASDWEDVTHHYIETKAGADKALHVGHDAKADEASTTGADRALLVRHVLDADAYYTVLRTEEETTFSEDAAAIRVLPAAGANRMQLSVSFYKENEKAALQPPEVFAESTVWWKNYWEKGGVISFAGSKDPRAYELERRIVLSQYLMAVNSAGSQPPQETGLTCNSWYGKMHLEMYLWHEAWLPLWNHTDLLIGSLDWYVDHIEEARDNARRNAYAGARWPKMIASEGIDCPSAVAPLLVWQQPHIIFMLELAYRRNPSPEFLKRYWILIKETADFMADFVHFNEETGYYDIPSPVIPVQECHHPEDTVNPAFEVEYWAVTLKIARDWADRLHKTPEERWVKVGEHMAGLTEADGVYLAHAACPDTFKDYNRDHPSMLMAYGLLDGRADTNVMRATLDRVLACWNETSLWGWDFAVMAMTATRLGMPGLAIDILLKDTAKNRYVVSGNNWQESRKDLPLYLPGNGSLLLAIPLMAAGYPGCKQETPGFPKDGNWKVEYEGISPFFA